MVRTDVPLSQIRPLQHDYLGPVSKSVHEMNGLSLNFGPILTPRALDITNGFYPDLNVLTVQAQI